MTQIDPNNKNIIMTEQEKDQLFVELKSDILKKLVKPAVIKVIYSTIISALLITFSASGIYYTVKADVFELKNNVEKLNKMDIELWKTKSNKEDLEYLKRELDDIKKRQMLILTKMNNGK